MRRHEVRAYPSGDEPRGPWYSYSVRRADMPDYFHWQSFPKGASLRVRRCLCCDGIRYVSCGREWVNA